MIFEECGPPRTGHASSLSSAVLVNVTVSLSVVHFSQIFAVTFVPDNDQFLAVVPFPNFKNAVSLRFDQTYTPISIYYIEQLFNSFWNLTIT